MFDNKKRNKDIVVLGMAKSSQDLKGAKNQKLELDLLRLIYAVKEINAGHVEHYQNMCAYGVLTVANEAIKNRAEKWKGKYGCTDNSVIIHIAEINESEMTILQNEKNNNAKANTRHINSNIDAKAASGINGESKYEESLKLFCDKLFEDEFGEDFEPIESLKYPFEVKWDYLAAVKKI